jgi:hypothetical protein
MSYRKHQQSLSSFFSTNSELGYFNDVGLLQELGCTHNPEEWWLFVGSSKFILKAVLLHNRNIHLSIPISHSVQMNETYKNMDLLLKAVSYSKYRWKICGDLKVIGLLLGMQFGYTKLCYFLCEWDSWAKYKHYKIKDWPMPENSVPGKKHVRNQPLFDKDKICYWHYTLNWGYWKLCSSYEQTW